MTSSSNSKSTTFSGKLRTIGALLVLSIGATGCTVGQTRMTFGLSVLADGATTQAAISGSNATEANPVLKAAPIPILLILSGGVALLAEKQIKNGEESKGKNLYRVATVLHGLAAAWNGYQLSKSPGTPALAASTALPTSSLSLQMPTRTFTNVGPRAGRPN